MQALKSPVSAPVNNAPETEDFHFSFFMDMNKWIQLQTEARFVFRERDSHNSKTVFSHLLYYIFKYFLCIYFLYLLNLENIFSAVATIFFIALLPLRRMISPEKSIRKNMQNFAAQSILLGNWDICFTASGISYSIMQKTKYFCLGQNFLILQKRNTLFIYCAKTIASSSRFPKSVCPVMNRRWLFHIMIALAFCLFLVAGMLHSETLIYPMKVYYDWIDSDVLNGRRILRK